MNLSCGYYKPHTDQEFINLFDVDHCHHFIAAILENIGDKKYHHEVEFEYQIESMALSGNLKSTVQNILNNSVCDQDILWSLECLIEEHYSWGGY
jgi:hypothetical protein